MSELIRIPARFFVDHAERGLPTPKLVRMTARFAWIEADDESTPRLLEDAREYVRAHEADRRHSQHGLFKSAQKTVAAIDAVLVTRAAIEKASKPGPKDSQ